MSSNSSMAPPIANDDEAAADARTTGSHKRSPMRALVQDFDPIWFTWSMNAGIIGILLHDLPYQFNGLPVLTIIAFMVDLVLFLITSALLLMRFVWFGKQAYREIVGNTTTLALLATWPIALLTLVSFIVFCVTDVYWGGRPWTVVAYVIWWIGAAWMMSMLLFVFMNLIIQPKEVSDRHLPPHVFIPAVGVSTVATIGGLLASYAVDLTASEAIPVIIFSFCAAGVALFMAIFLYGYLFHQMLATGPLPPEESAAMFMFVGPLGQIASALQVLSSAASTYGKFAEKNQGVFLTEQAAAPLSVACILLALLMTGMAAIWFLLACVINIYHAWRRELVWTPAWNAVIFPTGTFVNALLMFSIEMDSDFFRVMACIGTVFLILMFFVNLAFTTWETLNGRLLIIREDWRVKKFS